MDQQIFPGRKSPERDSRPRLMMAFLLCTALSPASWHGPEMIGCADAAENQRLTQVRMSLDSEIILDPLPFDTPFLMTGQAPASVQRIEVRITEMLGKMEVFGDNPESVETFRKKTLTMFSSFLESNGAYRGIGDIAGIQDHLAGLLIQSGKDKWPGPGVIGDILPWNWGNWSSRFESCAWQVIAPETIFDPDAASGASLALLKERLAGITVAETETDRRQMLDTLVGEVISEAKAARIARIVRSGPSLSPLRWQRVTGGTAAPPDSVTALSPPSLIWNRLESRIRPAGSRNDEPSEFAVLCPPLQANRHYLIEVRFERKPDTNDSPGGWGNAPPEKSGEGDRAVHRTLYSDTEADNSVSADAGLLYAGAIHTAVPYLGINYYFRPLNRDVPLRAKGGFLRRFSLTCGLTLKGIADDAGTRENLFQSQALVTGAGYRLTRHIRGSGGFLVFREHDPQTFPLSGDTRIAVTPYLALSFDADAWKYMKGMGRMIGSREGK